VLKSNYYVLVYAFAGDEFVLVRKKKPEWQKGRLNLVGGKVEPNEPSIDAAIRELQEETGLMAKSIVFCGQIQDKDTRIDCFTCRVSKNELSQDIEEVAWYKWADVKRDKDLIPNLRLIIPLLAYEVIGWKIEDSSGGFDVVEHQVGVSLPGGLQYEGETCHCSKGT